MTKPLLVTGAAGFIGARVVEHCNRAGVPVVSVDTEVFFREREEHRELSFGKIIDRDKLFDWLTTEMPELSGVVHMGACSDTTELDEAYLAKVNTQYTQHLWEYCTAVGLPFVYASSAATYGGGEFGYDDDESLLPKLKPLNPYGESKHRFDLWALEQEQKGNHPPSWCGLKFFNVYGFGERHKGKMASVVLHAVDQIRSTGKMRLFRSHKPGIADGHQKRDFITVEDVVSVIDFALRKPIPRGIYNLGSGHARTFVDLVTPVFEELGLPTRIEFIDTPPVLRERYQYFTEAKMQRLVNAGYNRPFTELEAGVKKYVRKL